MFPYEELRRALQKDLEVDPDYVIRDGYTSPVMVAKIALVNSLLKKREDWPEAEIAKQKAAALTLFLQSDRACAEWSHHASTREDERFDEMLKSYLFKMFEPTNGQTLPFGLPELREHMMVGPGAARGANADNFYTKVFASPLSATSSYLITLYRAAVSEIPWWGEAEFIRSTAYGFEIVNGSSYFSVPKKEVIQRSCATEPNINMMFQKALGTWMSQRMLAVTGIDLETQQDKNRWLAYRGSTTGLYGTMDLTSASDRNSRTMITHFFPRSLVGWMDLVRSPSVLLPNGTEHKMEMMSSMGNGFTFPLQTALFVGVVAVCYELLGIHFKRLSRDRPDDWAVNGDDIIVRREAYDLVAHHLQRLGHIVNLDKSYNTGCFRESCGSDWYAGYNVRGVYIKSLRSQPEIYSAINRLVKWSAKWDINLAHTLSFLLGQVEFLTVPFDEGDDAGVKVPFSKRTTGGKKCPRQSKRISRDWQATPYRCCVSRLKKAVVKVLSSDAEETLATHSIEEPESPGKGNDDCYDHPGNVAGWVVTALAGFAGTPPYIISRREDRSDPTGTIGPWFIHHELKRPVEIGIRSTPEEDVVRWKVKWRATSHWDEVPKLAGPNYSSDRGHAWAALAGNLEFLKLLKRE